MHVFSRRVLLLITILANIVYIVWRIFCTIPQGHGYISLFFAISLLVVEIVSMFEMFVQFKGMNNLKIPELPIIDEDLYPDVDVFITTYNESIDLVQKTVNGCKRMQYPNVSKVHIYVCDDGKRVELEKMAQQMGVHYISRENNKFLKAGNLNNALSLSNSPLVVTFDADTIPMHNFLLETVPYFLQNKQAKKEGKEEKYPKVGFVQTPQSFYNNDLFQFNLHLEGRAPKEQDYFNKDIQIAKNSSNSVIYGGNNTVLSREALNEIGGFYTKSLTEDFATGLLIQSKKYVCFATNKVCASGLAMKDLRSLMRQKERLVRGCIQTARRTNLLFKRGLTLKQKSSYFSVIAYWSASVKRFFYIVSPIAFAVFGILVVDTSLLEAVIFWVPTHMLTSYVIKKHSNNVRNTRWTNIYETIIFNALMPAVILETLCISKNKFVVTKKNRSESSDRYYRIWQSLPYFIYVALSLIGIYHMVVYTFVYESASYIVVLVWLLANLFNLIMSLFFILGRIQFRKSDRFYANVNMTLTQGTFCVNCETSDISEGGFSFILSTPEYITPDKPFDVVFKMPVGNTSYECSLKGHIAQVAEVKENWRFACSLDLLKEEDIDTWNAIVHNRVPISPETIDSTIGFYEDLEINIKRRVKRVSNYGRKLARILLNCEVESEGYGKFNIINCNYHFVLVEKEEAQEYPRKLVLPINDDVCFECSFVKNDRIVNEALYKIDNIEAIMDDKVRRISVLAFMKRNSKKKKVYDDMKNQTSYNSRFEDETQVNFLDYL